MKTFDPTRLFSIAARIVDVQTVKDAQQLAQKIKEAADIVTQAGIRIMGLPDDGRTLLSPEQETQVTQAIAEYQKGLTQ